jgi:glutamate carboxypeptidase
LNRLLEHSQSSAPRLLAEIQELVSIESPSQGRRQVNAAMNWAEKRLSAAGAAVSRISQKEAGDQVIARMGKGPSQTLLLGHLDTVWDVGQLQRMPVKVEGGKAFGPGIFDMKSGAVLMIELFRMAAGGVIKPRTALAAFFNSDEEVGSVTSRPALEKLAAECSSVLVFEPCLPGGRVKTFRKGVGNYSLEIFGREAHAGIDPGAGVSAIEELAHQVLALKKMIDRFSGSTINVGVVHGGTRTNVVPGYLRAELDVRIASIKDGEAIDRNLKSLGPVLPGARIQVSGGINRPPLERSDGVVQLFQAAGSVAQEQGWTLQEGETGGGSDGSFTAALGIPTLDGLGVDGDGAHAVHEHILIDDIPRRLALAAGLLEKL